MSEDFPKEAELIQLDQIRINRNLDKLCQCTNRKFVIDTTNKRVVCATCGAVIDPFDALVDMARWFERKNNGLKELHEQAVALSQYKPWLKAIKSIESNYRGHKMLPSCPRCGEPFYLEELSRWMGKEYANKRIEFIKRKEQEKDEGSTD